MKIQEKYARTVFAKTGMLPTWPADTLLSVGDVVTRTSDSFGRETHIDMVLGGPVGGITERFTTQRFRYQSDVTFAVSHDGTLPGVNAKVGFRSNASFLAVAEGGKVAEYVHLFAVRQAILALHAEGKWLESWQVVTSVRSFDAGTLVIAEKANAEAQLQLGLALDGIADPLGSIKAGGRATWLSGGGVVHELGPCTLMYTALWVRKPVLRRARTANGILIQAGGDQDGPVEYPVVEAVTLEDADLVDPADGAVDG